MSNIQTLVEWLVLALLFFGFILTIMAKNSKDKNNIDEDPEEESPSKTPDSSPKSTMRNYTVKHIHSDGKEKLLRVRARDRFDAKFQAFETHGVSLSSILSVV